ncbi:MAG: hypothetical protein ACKO26_23440 [Planctomycetota bacterium]
MTMPVLADLLRWLAETPPEFREDPPLAAVLGDLLESLGHPDMDAAALARGEAGLKPRAERNRRLWILAACRLLWHPSFRLSDLPADGLRHLFAKELPGVAAITAADALVTEEDRREELVRRTLRAVGMGLAGETLLESEDRFCQVDSVEGRLVARGAAERERRAREVREAMAREAARMAAARYSSE